MKSLKTSLFALIFCPVFLFAQDLKTDIQVADSLFSARNFSVAVTKYSDLITRYGNESKPADKPVNVGRFYWRRGLSQNALNNTAPALADLTAALPYYRQISNSLSWVLLDRGRVYIKLSDYKAALKDYNDALVANPENFAVYLEMGFADYYNKDYQISVDDYTKGILSGKLNDAQMALAFCYRGNSKLRLNQYTEAINDYNEAIYRNPNLKVTYMMRAGARQRNGDYELSNQDYTKALELYKDDSKTLARIYDNRAINYRRLYKFEQALEDISRGLPLAINPAVLYWSRAALYAETGQCQLAIDEFKVAIAHYKDDNYMLAYMHQRVANEYYTLKNFQQSLEECKTALAIDSTDESTYFLLGKIYLKHLSKKNLADENFNKVLKLDTTRSSTAYIFSQFYLGNKSLAMDLLKKEVLKQKDKTVATISYYNIACMYAIMNDAENANIYLRKVIAEGYPKQFAANDEDLDNIRKTPEYLETMGKTNIK